MQCVQCGAQIMAEQVFCSKCGQPTTGAVAYPPTAPPAPPAQSWAGQANVPSPSTGFARPSRVARHLHVLGILWMIYSLLRLIPGVAMIAFSHMRFPFLLTPLPGPMREFLGPFLAVIGVIISALSVAGIMAGWGLIAHAPWARMLTIVLGCISLIHLPLGTALGIYTLWVLVPQDPGNEWSRLAGAHNVNGPGRAA